MEESRTDTVKGLSLIRFWTASGRETTAPPRLGSRDVANANNRLDTAGGPTMKPHQERVVAEKSELDDKRTKLTAFIGTNETYRTLDSVEQSRLNRQLEAIDALLERAR